MRYSFIEQHRLRWPIRVMCRVLQVGVSGFYDWRGRPDSARAVRRRALAQKIQRIHKDSRQTYGSPRVHQQLVQSGERVGVNMVANTMKTLQIKAKTAKPFKPTTTDSKHELKPAPNRLARNFSANQPNRVWVADITYIPTDEGWLYLSAVLDVFSRKVMGWSMANHLRATLVEDALTMALARRQPLPGDELVHHSDRGVQYASGDFQKLLSRHQIACSMSRRGDCYDNAMMESFFGTLKTELVDHENYATHETAKRSIFEYIECWYNRKRLHSSLGYVSPAAFEAKAA